MSNLYDASAQWAKRPDDERFESLQAMLAATTHYRDSAIQSHVSLDTLRVEADNGDLKLVGKANIPAKVTHYAFGQLARFASAPAGYTRSLPATLAAQCINHGLKRAAEERTEPLNVLFHKNGSLVTRAITTDSYDRVWNSDLVARIIKDVASEGWVVPPARPVREGQKGTRKATAADILPNQGDFGLAVKEGDEIAPAGLYASDHDMFAFLVNHTDPINDGTKLLNRGVFIQNSEVGDCALKFKLFTYDNVCGNHIVWGVGKVMDISIRHVKGADQSSGKTLSKALSGFYDLRFSMPSASQMENAIIAAKSKQIAASKEDVLDAVFKFAKSKGLLQISKSTLEAAYDVAEATPRYGSPRTVWGMVNGLTEYSQTSAFQDERTELDIQAGRVMEMAF